MNAMKKHADLIRLLIDDLPLMIVADRLGISQDYLHQKLHRLRKAARVRTNYGLVAKAIRMGIV